MTLLTVEGEKIDLCLFQNYLCFNETKASELTCEFSETEFEFPIPSSGSTDKDSVKTGRAITRAVLNADGC